MKFLNGILIVAVFALVTACGGGAKTENTEGTDSAKTETASTENKNEETTKAEETQAPQAILTSLKWQMSLEAAMASIPEEEKAKMTEEDKKKMEEMVKMITMQFNADGSYIAGKGEEKGTWTLSEDGKTLTTKDSKGKEDVLTVKELAAEKLVLEKKEGEKTEEIILIPAKAETTTEGTTEEKKEEAPEKKEEEKKDGEHK